MYVDDFWSKPLSPEDAKAFISKVENKVEAGLLKVVRTSTGQTLNAMLIPAGFQVDRWIGKYYGGRVQARLHPIGKQGSNVVFGPINEFILPQADLTFIRVTGLKA